MAISKIVTNSVDSGVTLTSPVMNTITSAAATALTLQSAGVTAMTIDTSQNVGIGTSVPGKKLQVAGTTDQISVTTGINEMLVRANSTEAALYTFQAIPLNFYTNNTERMRISSGGQVTIASDTLYITNIPTTATSGNCLISSGEGNKFYRSTSSIKYKRNVVDMQRGITDVLQLRPVNFNGVSDFDGDKLFAGFIAEEVEALGFNEFVIYDDKGEPDGLQYANITSLLTKAIQEQQALILALTTRIAALEAK